MHQIVILHLVGNVIKVNNKDILMILTDVFLLPFWFTLNIFNARFAAHYPKPLLITFDLYLPLRTLKNVILTSFWLSRSKNLSSGKSSIISDDNRKKRSGYMLRKYYYFKVLCLPFDQSIICLCNVSRLSPFTCFFMSFWILE